MDVPSASYPSSQSGWHDEPEASESVQSPTEPFSGATEASQSGAASSAMHVARIRTPKSEHVVTPETTYPLSHRGEHVVPASMVREHLVLPVPTSPFSGGSDASHKSTGVGMTHSVIVSSPNAEHIVMPIVSYPSSHSGWQTSPGKSVSLFSQLSSPVPAPPFSGNVTVHFEGSIGSHVALVVITPSAHTNSPRNVNPVLH